MGIEKINKDLGSQPFDKELSGLKKKIDPNQKEIPEKKNMDSEKLEKANKGSESLTLKQEINKKYVEYEKQMENKNQEIANQVPKFQKILKSFQRIIGKEVVVTKVEEKKPQLEIYEYAKDKFDMLENKFGREKVMELIESMVASGFQPWKDDEKGKADRGRIDSILNLKLDLIQGDPNYIVNLIGNIAGSLIE